MQETATVQCPYCGEKCEVPLDPAVPSERFITDCEVCCRPFIVHVECELGQVLSIEASAE